MMHVGYLCECKPQVRVPEEARRGFPPLELEPQQVMSWQCGCWELSLGPLQVLFTAELSRRATNLKLPSLHGKLKTTYVKLLSMFSVLLKIDALCRWIEEGFLGKL